MEKSNQYRQDSARLAELLERFTGIPREKSFHYLMENAPAKLHSCVNLLCKTETQRNKLSALFEVKRLYETIKGMEENHAYTMDGPEAAKKYFKNLFEDRDDRERVLVAFLDSGSNVITTKTMATGTLTACLVSTRELVKEALFHNAAGVIMAHNHPSGDASPSLDDIRRTAKLHAGMEAAGIILCEHIIVGKGNPISLSELGLIPEPADLLISRYGSDPSAREATDRQAQNRQAKHKTADSGRKGPTCQERHPAKTTEQKTKGNGGIEWADYTR